MIHTTLLNKLYTNIPFLKYTSLYSCSFEMTLNNFLRPVEIISDEMLIKTLSSGLFDTRKNTHVFHASFKKEISKH